MTALYADTEGDNISWEGALDLPGWEPWEPDEDDLMPSGGCDYCGTFEDIREYPDPIGGKRCCEGCFNQIIGGERDDPPWRCGTSLDIEAPSEFGSTSGASS